MEETKKLSYEELEQLAAQLGEQNRQLYTRLQSAENTAFFKRMDYLFKVLEHAHIFDEQFVQNCVAELQEVITITEEPKEE